MINYVTEDDFINDDIIFEDKDEDLEILTEEETVDFSNEMVPDDFLWNMSSILINELKNESKDKFIDDKSKQDSELEKILISLIRKALKPELDEIKKLLKNQNKLHGLK